MLADFLRLANHFLELIIAVLIGHVLFVVDVKSKERASLHLLHEAGQPMVLEFFYIQGSRKSTNFNEEEELPSIFDLFRNSDNVSAAWTFFPLRNSLTRASKLLMACSIPMRFENLCFAIAKTRQKLHVHTRAFAFILSVNIAKIESFQSIIRRLDIIYVIYCSKP